VTLLGGALIAIAILGVVWWSMAQMGSVKSFAAPGQIVYAAATTDSVTIWHQIQVASGRGPIPPSFVRPPEGVTIRVTDQSTGRSVPMQTAPKLVERFGTATRLSLYEFTPPAPGNYVVSATGPACTLAVGGGDPSKTTAGVFAAGCGGCFGGAICLLGVIMLIITMVRHASAATPKAPRPPPGPQF
jgi:hypothetical protein